MVAEVEGVPAPDPDEVDDLEWVAWDALVERARLRPETLSPWSVEQIGHLAALAPSPLAWLDDNVGPDAGALGEVCLDRAPDEPPPSDWDPIATVRGPVDDVLRTFLAEQESALAGMGRTISEMSDEVHNLMDAGGKRLRPAFVYWGHRATGAGHDDGVYRAAAAVELLHTFALIHDDVMDRSRTRRGRPTAQRSLAELHGREGLQGDGAWFGLSGALLAGDLAFVWADQLLETAPLPAEAVAAARRVFTHLRTEVISGQYLDVRLSHAPVGEQAEREALQVALLKSARYTVTRPLELGVALAGRRLGGERLRAALARYGDAVGLAFQMRDDILGLYGDSELMGKSCLDDLREGKRTLLVLRALRLTSGDDKQFLEGSLGDPDLDATAALRCCRIVATSGALASVEALVEAQRARALRAIAGIDGPAQAALEQLAASATRRDR